MGLCSRGSQGAGVGAAGLHQLRGRLRVRDGHRQAARAPAAAGEPRHPGLRLGRNGSDDRARRGHRARRDHHHLGQVGDARRAQDRQGRHPAGQRRRGAVHHQRRLPRARRASSSSTSTGSATTPPRTGRRATRTTSTASTSRARPSIFQETAFRFTDGSGRDAAAAGCLATGLRALNAVPAVNDLPPGWVTPLDLPLIAGEGTIR